MMQEDIKIGGLFRIVPKEPYTAENSSHFAIIPLSEALLLPPRTGKAKNKTTPRAKSVLVIGGNEMERAVKRTNTVSTQPLKAFKASRHIMADEHGSYKIGQPILISNCVEIEVESGKNYLLDIVVCDRFWKAVAYDPKNCRWNLKQISNEDDLRDI